MAAALPFIAIGMQVAGGVMGAIDESKGLKAQARTEEENARRTYFQGELDAQGVRRDARVADGEMIASDAGSGLALGTGSLADMVAQSARNRQADIANIRRGASGQADNYLEAARGHRKAAKKALVRGLFNTAANAISSVSGMSASNAQSKQASREHAATSNRIPVGAIRMNVPLGGSYGGPG